MIQFPDKPVRPWKEYMRSLKTESFLPEEFEIPPSASRHRFIAFYDGWVIGYENDMNELVAQLWQNHERYNTESMMIYINTQVRMPRRLPTKVIQLTPLKKIA